MTTKENYIKIEYRCTPQHTWARLILSNFDNVKDANDFIVEELINGSEYDYRTVHVKKSETIIHTTIYKKVRSE